MNKSLKQILEKRVVPSLEPLFDNTRMDADLRKLIRETFPDFSSNNSLMDMKPEDFVPPIPGGNVQPVNRMDLIVEAGLDYVTSGAVSGGGNTGVKLDGSGSDLMINNSSANHVNDADDAMFSDEEDDINTNTSSHQSSTSVPKSSGGVKSRTSDELTNSTTTNSSSLSSCTSYNSSHLSNSSCSSPPSPPLHSNNMVGNTTTTSTSSTNLNSVSLYNSNAIKVENNDIKCGERTPNEMLSADDKQELVKHLDYLEKDMKGLLQDYQMEKDLQTR